MITRLRSEKGSFVRSPLGAFDSEEAPPGTIATGVVQGVSSTTGNSAYVDAPQEGQTSAACRVNVAGTVNVPPGADIYDLVFDTLTVPADQDQVTGIYKGDTSGAEYSPTTYAPGGPLYQWCTNSSSSRRVYVSSDFTTYPNPPLFDFVSASQLIETQSGTSALEVYLRAGAIPFIEGETFTYTY